jgi:hypothetical protein
MGLKTPDKIRTFQRKLYLKAKAEPDFRFYLLYDKIYRADILQHAYRLVKANKSRFKEWISGCPGSESNCTQRRTNHNLFYV